MLKSIISKNISIGKFFVMDQFMNSGNRRQTYKEMLWSISCLKMQKNEF